MNARFISLAQPDPLSSRLPAKLTFPLGCFIGLSNLACTLCRTLNFFLQRSFLSLVFVYVSTSDHHLSNCSSRSLGVSFLFPFTPTSSNSFDCTSRCVSSIHFSPGLYQYPDPAWASCMISLLPLISPPLQTSSGPHLFPFYSSELVVLYLCIISIALRL